MVKIEYKALVKKMNHHTKKAFEGAAGLCVQMTHYDLELEHFLYKLVETNEGDIYWILKQHGIDQGRMLKKIHNALENLKTGNGNLPGLSPQLPRILQDAWMLGSVEYGFSRVRSVFILLALLQTEETPPILRILKDELIKIPLDEFRKNLLTLIKKSSEETDTSGPDLQETEVSSSDNAAIPSQAGKNLAKFTIDLTKQAQNGKIDPIVGRDREIRDAFDILLRRRKNNPLLIGDAGVGKTAIVEGMALRIAGNDVPESLQNTSILTLDLGSLQAGAGVRGEFENRLKNVIQEVTSSAKPVILFIDEIHTLMGAGGKEGSGDAANLLKPALARGELRTIGATTRTEHKQFIAKDAALDRRFQTIEVDEPDIERATLMIRSLIPVFEKHHNIQILEDAVHNAVALSSRYISGRNLPDKAVDLIDTACSRVSLAMAATPPELEDCIRTIDNLNLEIKRLERENVYDSDLHAEKLTELEKRKSETTQKLEKLESQWQEEKKLVSEMRELRGKIDSNTREMDRLDVLAEIQKKSRDLEEIQGEKPLISINVDGQAIAKVVSSWTGVPVGKMIKNEMTALLSMKEQLSSRVMGQDHALTIISNSLRTARYNLGNPDQPIGIFLLVGPSGTGKTETALALSDILFGGEHNIISLNMSEFKEQHSSARLIGPPPGYAGFGKGGLLTEKVRHRPYSVVLLDEIEKAHRDVREFFQQVFDKGYLSDTEGQIANFRNTVVIMTANIGDETILDCCFQETDEGLILPKEPMPPLEDLVKALQHELLHYFSTSMLARITIVPYYPLTDEVLNNIIELKLKQIEERLKQNHKIDFEYETEVVNQINMRCTEVQSGARNVNRIINSTILPQITSLIIERLAEGTQTRKIVLSSDEKTGFGYELQ